MEYWRRKKQEKENGKAKECFLRNGSLFLEELIADCNGISSPIRMFSSDQISKTIDDPKFSILDASSSFFTWYKGHTEDRAYTIKRYTHRDVFGGDKTEYNDIALSSRVSNHSGFLKLIGCCLEFTLPVLVFEELDYRFLNERGTVGRENAALLLWNVRLKIAKDIAIAITYLHTAFPRIIIHRDIKPTNVFVDKNGKAKLSDFSRAITLPEGKSWADEPPLGTMGHIDPTYLAIGLLTEYSDVFSFGILMLVLLMGRPAYLEGSDGRSYFNILGYVEDLQERGEPVVFGGDSNDMKPDQMKMFLELALRCCERRNENRPKMIMVAKEIKLIEKGSFDCSEMLENGSEDG